MKKVYVFKLIRDEQRKKEAKKKGFTDMLNYYGTKI
jgi:hypothetical protein